MALIRTRPTPRPFSVRIVFGSCGRAVEQQGVVLDDGLEAAARVRGLVLVLAAARQRRGQQHDQGGAAHGCQVTARGYPARRMADSRKIRVVVAKPGLDGHDRGAKIIARALRDAGMEVIYTGLHQTPEQIVETVLQEDANAVGLSILSGAHMTLVPKIARLLEEQNAEDVVLVVGGTIPSDDIPELKELGVAEVFTPGSSVQEIVDYIEGAVPA